MRPFCRHSFIIIVVVIVVVVVVIIVVPLPFLAAVWYILAPGKMEDASTEKRKMLSCLYHLAWKSLQFLCMLAMYHNSFVFTMCPMGVYGCGVCCCV